MTSIASIAASTLGARRAASLSRWLIPATAVVLGNLLLWASAKVQVPFWPVPMTMQTYVVLTLGGLFGWRLGAAAVAAYLIEGFLGLPVFAGTPANGIGLAYMAGASGGYLVGYVVAVVLVGLVMERSGKRFVLCTAAALLAGELAILGLGYSWLALQIGWEKALTFGIAPFLFGDAVKLVLAGATIAYGKHLRSILIQ